MRLDDPKAVEVLKAAVEKAQSEKDARDARLAELKAMHHEYVRLEKESERKDDGKTGLRGLRIQLSFALLYREIGISHLEHGSQVATVMLPDDLTSLGQAPAYLTGAGGGGAPTNTPPGGGGSGGGCTGPMTLAVTTGPVTVGYGGNGAGWIPNLPPRDSDERLSGPRVTLPPSEVIYDLPGKLKTKSYWR